MIFDSKADDLFRQFTMANEEETAATKRLSSYQQNTECSDTVMKELFQNWENAQNKKMEIWRQLQPFRLDR